MITLVGEHLGRYGNSVVADPKCPDYFSNDDGLPVINAHFGYITNRRPIDGDDGHADEFFYRSVMLLELPRERSAPQPALSRQV